MMVRARDNIYRMKDLKGKKVGLTTKVVNSSQKPIYILITIQATKTV